MQTSHSDTHRTAAFTLIELSVVLAIIGLLVGGVLAGVGIRRGAELRSVSASANAHVAAIQQFLQQYGYPPGDFPNATKVWGRATSGAASTAQCTTPATDAGITGSCNGDGNGVIDAGVDYEYWRAWQQLALAGFIEGSYTGVAATASGVNEPTTLYTNSAFAFYNTNCAGNCSSDTNAYDGDYTNALYFGAFSNSNHTSGAGAVLSGEEALSVDTKFDDSYPAVGNIRSWKPALLSTCTSGSTSDTASAYVATGGDVAACSLIFMNTYHAIKNGQE